MITGRRYWSKPVINLVTPTIAAPLVPISGTRQHHSQAACNRLSPPVAACLPCIPQPLNFKKTTVNNYDELAARLGEKLGESEWILVDQERINLFADATLDHQWIHVEPERAAVESPYKSTIAHGYLTLSLLPHMWQEIIEVNNLKMMVNYGMDKMRFGRPVLTGSRIRLVASLDSIENLRGICKAGIKFQIEIEGERKPALEGIATFLYYFE